jgi:hypothetical protein
MNADDRPIITVDETALRVCFDAEEVHLPDLLDDKPAGDLTMLFDRLVEGGIVTVPEPYRISLINDDEVDITGLVVNVEVAGTGWPHISDGWSEIDNYLPRLDHEGDRQGWDELLNAIYAIIGRADRCIAFAHAVATAVADGDDALSGAAATVLGHRILGR